MNILSFLLMKKKNQDLQKDRQTWLYRHLYCLSSCLSAWPNQTMTLHQSEIIFSIIIFVSLVHFATLIFSLLWAWGIHLSAQAVGLSPGLWVFNMCLRYALHSGGHSNAIIIHNHWNTCGENLWWVHQVCKSFNGQISHLMDWVKIFQKEMRDCEELYLYKHRIG